MAQMMAFLSVMSLSDKKKVLWKELLLWVVR